MLEIKDLNVHYGVIHALKGISLNVGEGEIVTLIGGMAQVKLQLFSTISGLIKPTSGEILLNGTNIGQTTARNSEDGYFSCAGRTSCILFHDCLGEFGTGRISKDVTGAEIGKDLKFLIIFQYYMIAENKQQEPCLGRTANAGNRQGINEPSKDPYFR